VGLASHWPCTTTYAASPPPNSVILRKGDEHAALNYSKGMAPFSMLRYCIAVSSADTRRHLRLANRHLLAVPRFQLNTYGCRVFSVAGPIGSGTLSRISSGTRQSVQTVLDVFSRRTCSLMHPAHWGCFDDNALYKFTYLLTYLLTFMCNLAPHEI